MGDRRRPNEHIYCFVPSDGIDIVVLATFLKRFIDGTATIKPSRHPRKKDELGYNVGADKALSREALEDLIRDTADWAKEQQTYEFQDAPYEYNESDTWIARKKAGPTPPRVGDPPPRTITRRTRHETQEDDGSRDNSRSNPKEYTINNPRTFSETSASTQSTIPSSVFSRDHLSTLSEDSIEPSESASQIYSYETTRGPAKGPPPKPVGPQPRPDTYKSNTTSYGFDRLAISDYNKPNQSVARQQQQQTTTGSRHDPAKEDTKPAGRPAARTGGPRKDIYEESYH